ncbi:hypothetical protein [Pedobacter sp. KBS0701]|uniref:hypothetical protein n=1 Tax=unclassified Pedobacter TaxID=2628915 RepID=UPI00110F51D5|nr:hypothetical protein [Pedobacter sp. KBS0701]QDW24527.1 hypothetical protein FFJ24_006735 [Pedobacter sp. KBS0701]
MDYEINENRNLVKTDDHTITDCSHLIDLAPVKNVFDGKVKGTNINHPKACIKILTTFSNKNGLANLL